MLEFDLMVGLLGLILQSMEISIIAWRIFFDGVLHWKARDRLSIARVKSH
jgi:hypothetical protein